MRRACFAAACLAAAPTLALDLSGRDRNVAACTDFYRHVNGAWEAKTELPPERARAGTFEDLRQRNDRVLEKALADLGAGAQRPGSPALDRLAIAYRAAMNLNAIEKNSLAALKPLLARIDRLKSKDELPALIGELLHHGVAAPLQLWVGADAKDVRRHALYLVQGGLGLPDRDDYLRPADAESRRLLGAYRSHARKLIELNRGEKDDSGEVDALLAFEAKLAKASMTRVERRDPKANYNPTSVKAMVEIDKGFDWATLVAAALGQERERALAREVVVGQPAFMRAVAALAREAPIADWQRYLRVRLLDEYAPHLPRAYARSHFEYREGSLRGVWTEPPRAERVVQMLGGPTGAEPLGQALGELYVSKAFSPQAQQRAMAMVEDIRQAMRERIRALGWMSEATKQRALTKLDAMALQIGAPAQWRDVSALVLKDDDHAGNMLRIAAWEMRERGADLDTSVVRERWTVSPHVVNAFAGSLNRIVFPAGILQPPFFEENADDAVNYGAIGAVIGHEITHHFDDRGRQFDDVGNLADWWSAEDAAAYVKRAERVVALYNGYEALPGIFVNGKQMLGENISDLSGLQIAFDGLQIAMARRREGGVKAEPIDGLTPEQRFFTANAIIWRGKQRQEHLMNQLRTGQHAPGRFRVRGPMASMPAFAQAFGCKPGDPMAAKEPVSVW
jgi:predicted metalloendopeptidase